MKKIFIVLLMTCFAQVGCKTALQQPAKINHLVFIGLKNHSQRAELVRDCDTKLASIQGVVTYWCGQHGDFGRETVDDTYDVGLCIGFNTEEDYNYYLKHQNHVDVVQKWSPRWDWIRIHDVVDSTRGDLE